VSSGSPPPNKHSSSKIDMPTASEKSRRVGKKKQEVRTTHDSGGKKGGTPKRSKGDEKTNKKAMATEALEAWRAKSAQGSKSYPTEMGTNDNRHKVGRTKSS